MASEGSRFGLSHSRARPWFWSPSRLVLSLEAAVSPRHAALSKGRLQWPAAANGLHACLRGCDPSLRVRILQPACWAPYLRAHPHGLVRSSFFQASLPPLRTGILRHPEVLLQRRQSLRGELPGIRILGALRLRRNSTTSSWWSRTMVPMWALSNASPDRRDRRS